MKILKKLIAGALCAAMACSLASCKDTSWAFKIDGVEIPAGMYISYQMNAYSEAASLAEDSEKGLFEQKIEGQDAESWINNRALELCKTYVAVEKKFDELGLTLSDEDKNKVTDYIAAYWETKLSPTLTPNGVSRESYKQVLTNSLKSDAIFRKYYDKEGLEAVSDADLKKELSENYALVKYVKMPMKDEKGDVLKTEGKAELKKTAEKYLDRLKKGENIDDLIAEYETILEEQQKDDSTSSNTSSNTSSKAASSNTSSSAASSKASSDTSSKATSSGTSSGDTSSEGDKEEETDPNKVIIAKDNTSQPKKFTDAIFSAKVGEPTIVEDDENYYVTIRYDIAEDKQTFDEARDSMLVRLKSEDFKAMEAEWYKNYKVVTNDGSVKRYSPKKLQNV